MSTLGAPERSQTVCPFAGWVLIYLGGILLGELALPTLARATGRPWIGYPIVAVILANVAASLVVERSYGVGRQCNWLPQEAGGRITLYVIAFVVGLFVISPGLSPSRDILFAFRVIGGVAILSLMALLMMHLGSHGRGDGLLHRHSGLLAVVSRLPVFLLYLAVAFLALMAVLNLFVPARR